MSTRCDTPSKTKPTIDNRGKQNWRTVRFEVLERIEHLPSLSNVVIEFLHLARRDFYSAKDFEAVIRKDQALVARLLRVANSGLYGRARSINSIPEAVVLIGLENLKKVVYSVSAEGLVRHNMTHYGYHADQGFWLHALGVGSAASVLVNAAPECPIRGEEAMVAGLLHDVGKLVIDEFLTADPSSDVTREQEIEAVGLDHAELAEYILKQWNLPDSITTSILYHHDYKNGGEWQTAAAALTLAENICNAWGIGRSGDVDLSAEVKCDRFTTIIGDLGISANKWDQVIWDIQQALVKLEGVFEGG